MTTTHTPTTPPHVCMYFCVCMYIHTVYMTTFVMKDVKWNLGLNDCRTDSEASNGKSNN